MSFLAYLSLALSLHLSAGAHARGDEMAGVGVGPIPDI